MPRVVPDLSRPQRIHIVAVGGAAMSAIAHILHHLGHTITGSDQADSPVLDRLRAEGIPVQVGHDAAFVDATDFVIVSTAVPDTNPELGAATARGVPVAGRPDVMEALGRERRTIAISGTHGKTTTTAMTAMILRSAGWDPSFIVGGMVRQLGTGVAWRPTEWFVVEADESDGSFVRFGAEAVIVTNIEEDHLDHWGTMSALEDAFVQFVGQAAGPRIVMIDDAGCRRLLDRLRERGAADSAVTVGQSNDATVRITGYEAQGLRSSFRLERVGYETADVVLQVPGLHNARNASAAMVLAMELGIDAQTATAALAGFTGVARRFEWRGEARGVTFVDDYAHLPTEVAATVQAAIGGGWGRVIAVFQPHRYTRVAALAEAFADSFVGADAVIVTGVYAAGQGPIAGVSARNVHDAILGAHPRQTLLYAETRNDVVRELVGLLQPGDLCITMNAGDLTTLPDELLQSAWASETGAGS